MSTCLCLGVWPTEVDLWWHLAVAVLPRILDDEIDKVQCIILDADRCFVLSLHDEPLDEELPILVFSVITAPDPILRAVDETTGRLRLGP